MSRQRIAWIDLAKGIAIISVVWEHTDFSIIRSVIGCFNISLFFILSGYTYNPSLAKSDLLGKAKNSYRQLIIPAFVLAFLTLFYQFVVIVKTDWLSYVLESLKALFFFNAVPFEFFGHPILGVGIKGNMYHPGIVWFLVAFFIARVLYDIINYFCSGKSRIAVVTILTVLGIMISRIVWLPFQLDLSFTTLGFIEFGRNTRIYFKTEKVSWKRFLINATVLMGGAFLMLITTQKCTALAIRRFPLFPLSYFVAVVGALAIVDFSILLSKLKILKNTLCNLGALSLDFLFVHVLDFLWMSPFEEIIGNGILLAGVRLLIDIVVFYAYIRIRRKQFIYI